MSGPSNSQQLPGGQRLSQSGRSSRTFSSALTSICVRPAMPPARTPAKARTTGTATFLFMSFSAKEANARLDLRSSIPQAHPQHPRPHPVSALVRFTHHKMSSRSSSIRLASMASVAAKAVICRM